MNDKFLKFFNYLYTLLLENSHKNLWKNISLNTNPFSEYLTTFSDIEVYYLAYMYLIE